MKKTIAILVFITGLLPAGTAFAAHTGSSPGSRTEPVTVADAAPRILELINRERTNAGLASLVLDEEVAEIALRWSREMALADRLSHNDAYLSAESMERLNATTLGENVAFASSVEEIHTLLMESPPHRANILSPDYRLVGVGAVRSSTGDLYLTEGFLTRRAAPASREERATPARPAKSAPSARREKRPAPRRATQSQSTAGSRPVAAKAPHMASTAPVPAPKPAPPPPPSAPPAQTAPPTSAPPPPAAAPAETPVELAAVEPPPVPEDLSEPEVTTEGPGSKAVRGLTLEGAADRNPPTGSPSDLLKGLPALILLRRRWFGRRR